MSKKNTEKRASFKELFSAGLYSQKLLFRYARGMFIVNGVSAVVDGVSPIIQAYLTGAILGELTKIPSGAASRDRLIAYVLASAFTGAIFYAVTTLRGYLFSAHREQLETALKGDLLEKKSTLPLEDFELPEVRDTFERAQVGLGEVIWLTRSLTDLASALISIIGILAVVAGTLPLLIIVLVPLPLVTGWARVRNYHLSRNMWEQSREHRIRASSIEYLFDAATSVMELRLFGLTKQLLGLWRQESKAVYAVRVKDELRSAKLSMWTEVVETLVAVGVDIWLVFKVFAGAIQVSLFEQSRRLVSSYMLSLSRITNASADLIVDGHKMNDYRSFMVQPVTRRQLQGTIHLRHAPQEISLRDVSFSYPTGARSALKNISLSLRAGEHIALVGENGAGKTTLLKVLLGLYRTTEGMVLIDDVPIHDIDVSSLHEYVAPLLQDFSNFAFLTIKESVAVSDMGHVNTARVKAVLKTVNLWDFVESLPKKMDTDLGYVRDEGIKLSGGQWQRLAIARALYKQAPILVLDEPTSAIDAKSEQEIVDTIFQEYTGKTVVIVSHRVSTVRRADRIVMVQGGQIVEQGTHKELFTQGTAYYDLFHRQVKAVSGE